MIWMFDLDGTICHTIKTDYENATPIKDMIDRINRLYSEGNVIRIFTARGSRSGRNWRDLTEKQLKEWGVKFHELSLEKPFAHHYIGDEVMTITEFKKWMPL
jgi:hypothetical protein